VPGAAFDPASEIVTVVDEHDRPIRTTTRAEVRARNLLHRGVGILVRNRSGEIYVHRRTQTKDVFPGMMDMFVGGTVAAGEPYEQAAGRELAEELGITDAPLVYLFKHRYEGADNNCLTAVFEVVWDGEIVHQAEEIAWGAWLTEDEVISKLAEWDWVPDGKAVFEAYLAQKR
jgi:isopentenyldiphosphate isomerase